MVSTIKRTIAEEEWNFPRLLKGANGYEIGVCRLYEFGREVFDLEWLKENFRQTVGQSAMLSKHRKLVTNFFRFGVANYAVWSEMGWFEIPYFQLPKDFKDMAIECHYETLSGFVDARHSLDRGETLHLEIPVGASKSFLRDCFDAFLRQNFPEGEDSPNTVARFAKAEGAKAPIRQTKRRSQVVRSSPDTATNAGQGCHVND
jgi:hypothetical protein